VNLVVQRYIMSRAPQEWKVGIGGIRRVLYPLSALVFVMLGRVVLQHWQHTALLKLMFFLLLAMAAIRLSVYALRFVFSPSAWLKTAENGIVTMVSIFLVLHFAGVLPEIVQALDDLSITVGKSRISVLLGIQALLVALVTVVVALWVSRILENRLMRAEHLDKNLRVVLTKLLRVFLVLFGVLLALSSLGFDITLLSVFGGALGVGLGLGLQKIASNYVSGFILLLDDSLHMGDVITVENHYGIVSQMRSRYMVLEKLDGTEVVIPNETLITGSYISHTYSERKTRVMLTLQVSYESPLEEAIQLICQAAAAQPRVVDDPEAEVAIMGFGDNGIDLRLSFWIADPEEGSVSLKSAIYLEIWRRFKQHGVVIPYPQRDVRIVSGGE